MEMKRRFVEDDLIAKASKKRKRRKKSTKEDNEWAKKVKEKFNNCCMICGETKYVNAHHIIPRQIKEFRYDVRNGLALCPKHHRFSFELSAHQNPFIFYLGLETYNPRAWKDLVKMIRERRKVWKK